MAVYDNPYSDSWAVGNYWMDLQGAIAITNINNNMYQKCRTVNALALFTALLHDVIYHQDGAGFFSQM